MKKNAYKAAFLIIILITTLAVTAYGLSSSEEDQMKDSINLDIQANMIFLYYKDLTKAVDFYQNILGLSLVLDYGFAKAFQVSKTSFVCLVDEKKGMHSSTEPKTVTLSFITKEVDAWYKYLKTRDVKMHSHLKGSPRIPIRGFVALDCEGYFLEFETFMAHPQNKKLLPILNSQPSIYPTNKSRPKELGIQGTIFWLYYKDLQEAQTFYQNNLNLNLLVDQGFAKLYGSSATGFIGLVDESKGLHRFSEKKSVNIGFFTENIGKWYEYLLEKGLKMKDSLEEAVKGRVRAFVCYDTAGYFLEFDTFNQHKDNQTLLEILEENKKSNKR